MFRNPTRANGMAARRPTAAAIKRSPPGKSAWLSTAAFAARTAVERVQTRAGSEVGSSDPFPVNALDDFLNLGLFDGEIGDVEAVDDLLDRRDRGERAAV